MPRQGVPSQGRQDVACKMAGCRELAQAGCHAKARQGVAARPFAQKKTASLLAVSLPGCHQAASDRPAQRRSLPWSGRRGSNPRQPAWKAGGCALAARLVYIGPTTGFMRYTCNVSEPGKRCHVRFFRHSPKHVTCFAIDFGKRRCEQLGTGGHTTVETIPYPLVFDNGF